MSKIGDCRRELRARTDWESFLNERSGLPGPRANLSLAWAAAVDGFGHSHRLDDVGEEQPRNGEAPPGGGAVDRVTGKEMA